LLCRGRSIFEDESYITELNNYKILGLEAPHPTLHQLLHTKFYSSIGATYRPIRYGKKNPKIAPCQMYYTIAYAAHIAAGFSV